MQFSETFIPGLNEVIFEQHKDNRGIFTKSYQKTSFDFADLPFEVVECFHSLSIRNTIRGMHYQSLSCNQYKLVFCTSGEIHDVVLDIRLNSPTFGKFFHCILNQENPKGLLIPPGIAHGFCAISEIPALVNYYSSSEYDSKYDHGIHLNSFGFNWNIKNPIISERDKGFLTLSDYFAENR